MRVEKEEEEEGYQKNSPNDTTRRSGKEYY